MGAREFLSPGRRTDSNAMKKHLGLPTIYTVYTVYTVNTVYAVNNIALHCLNNSMYAYIYYQGRLN